MKTKPKKATGTNLSEKQLLFLARITQALEESSFNTPDTLEMAQSLGVPAQSVAGMLKLAVQRRAVIPVAEDVWYTPGQLEAMRLKLRETFKETPFSLSQARDLIATTRRYMAPLLDWFDAEKVTVRSEEGRVVSDSPIVFEGRDEDEI